MATYVKNTWESGDTITAALMNHIEEGLETIDNNLVSLDTTLMQEGDAAEAKAVGEQLNTKANVDGYYEELTSGSTEQLLSSKFTEDGVPYVYRKTGGSLDVGNRKLEKIVGGTIVWNQLYKQGDTDASTTRDNVTVVDHRDGSYTVSTTSEGASADFTLSLRANLFRIGNHVYFRGGAQIEKGICIMDNWSGWHLNNKNYGVYKRIDVTPDYLGYSGFTLSIASGTIINEPITFWPQYCDLTMMFGNTVADYIYSMQGALSNAGAELFKSLFPLTHYAYNPGELMSVQTAQHETIGFNQWDEEWEQGTFSTSTGANISRTDQIRSKNLIPVIPGAKYWFSMPIGVAWTMFLDENRNIVDPPELDGAASWLSSGHCVGISTRTFTMPLNAHYIRFYMTQSYGNTYKNDICLNLSWTGYRNGEYEPYSKHTYALQENLTLRGVPKLDANNHIYYDGDTYEADGTVTRRYGVVDLGTLSWRHGGAGDIFYAVGFDGYAPSSNFNYVGNLLCSKYLTTTRNDVNGGDKRISIIKSDTTYLVINDLDYASDTDAVTFKAAMSGVMLVYELATPTTEQATSYPEVQIIDDFGTERFVDTRAVAIPVGHSTKYMSNLRDKLQHLPDLAASDGLYMVKQANGQMTLTSSPLPAAPSQNGTYILKCIVSNGTPTYSWEAQP